MVSKPIKLDQIGRKNGPKDETPDQAGHKDGFPEEFLLLFSESSF